MPTELKALYNALSTGGTNVPILPSQHYDGTMERRRVGQVHLTYRKPIRGREVLVIHGITEPELHLRILVAAPKPQFIIDQPRDETDGVSCQESERAMEIIRNLCRPYLPITDPPVKTVLAKASQLLF